MLIAQVSSALKPFVLGEAPEILSIEQKTSGYNALYLTEMKNDYLDAGWAKAIKLWNAVRRDIFTKPLTKGLLVPCMSFRQSEGEYGCYRVL